MKNLQEKITRYLISKITDRELIKDLTQETLYKMLHQSKKEEILDKEAWSIRTARNLLIDHFRKEKRYLQLSDFKTQYDLFIDELLKCQEKYLKELDEESEMLIRKVDFNGLSQKQLASELRIGYVTLRSKVQRARGKIKASFERDCDLEYDPNGMITSCYEKKCHC